MNKETKVLIGLGLTTIFLLVAGSFFFTNKTSTVAPPKVADESLLVKSDSITKGPESPKVTIVEFGDFQCPSCSAVEPIVEEVLAEYKDSVRFVFRNYPLPMHANAFDAARAAEAANEQGKYWEMHHVLYSKQDEWAEKKDVVDLFAQYAKELNLDVDKFKSAITEKKFDERINADLRDGNAAGVNATPTFYINGVQTVGVLSVSQFKTVIDNAIQAATN